MLKFIICLIEITRRELIIGPVSPTVMVTCLEAQVDTIRTEKLLYCDSLCSSIKTDI